MNCNSGPYEQNSSNSGQSKQETLNVYTQEAIINSIQSCQFSGTCCEFSTKHINAGKCYFLQKLRSAMSYLGKNLESKNIRKKPHREK